MLRHCLVLLTLLGWLWPTLGLAQDVSTAGAQTAFTQGLAVNLLDYCNNGTALDNSCTATWLTAAEATRAANGGQVHVYAPAGTYRYNNAIVIPNGDNWHLRCEDPQTTIFQGDGTTDDLFVLQTSFGSTGAPWDNISIENCGFDMGGWDIVGQDEAFATLISMNGASHVTIRGNRFFDSTVPGRMCRLYSQCQRQYILLLNGNDLLIEQNSLSEGGRIKAGRPGSRILVQDNVIENINDNGITVVGDTTSNHFVIQRNVITHPIHSGIFFGTDGQNNGDANTINEDMTVRDNVILGDWSTACISATLGNHSARIFVARNLCVKWGVFGDQGTAAIAMNRNNTSVLAATQVTLLNNVVSSYVAPAFSEAVHVKNLHDTICVLGHQHHGGSNAIRWFAGTTTGILTGHDFHGGTNRNDGATVTIDGAYSGCYAPTVITPAGTDVESLGTGTWPTITITAPTTTTTLPTSTGRLTTLAGTASSGTATVTWRCDPGCGSGLAQGTTTWMIPEVYMQGPVNRVQVTATDGDGQRGTDQLLLLYTPADPQPFATLPARTGG